MHALRLRFTYPPPSLLTLNCKTAHHHRLRERPDMDVASMEESLVEAPNLEHTLDGWFNARLVARLAADLLAPSATSSTPTRHVGLLVAACGNAKPAAGRRSPGASADRRVERRHRARRD